MKKNKNIIDFYDNIYLDLNVINRLKSFFNKLIVCIKFIKYNLIELYLSILIIIIIKIININFHLKKFLNIY